MRLSVFACTVLFAVVYKLVKRTVCVTVKQPVRSNNPDREDIFALTRGVNVELLTLLPRDVIGIIESYSQLHLYYDWLKDNNEHATPIQSYTKYIGQMTTMWFLQIF